MHLFSFVLPAALSSVAFREGSSGDEVSWECHLSGPNLLLRFQTDGRVKNGCPENERIWHGC